MYFLFYSNKCIFSINLLNIIYNEDLDDKFIKIDIDDPKNKDKLFGIQKVPTIITKEIKSQLVGKAAFEWVKNKKYFHQITNNINYANTIINPNIKSDIDIKNIIFNAKYCDFFKLINVKIINNDPNIDAALQPIYKYLKKSSDDMVKPFIILYNKIF